MRGAAAALLLSAAPAAATAPPQPDDPSPACIAAMTQRCGAKEGDAKACDACIAANLAPLTAAGCHFYAIIPKDDSYTWCRTQPGPTPPGPPPPTPPQPPSPSPPPPAGQNYTCKGGACVAASKGLPIGTCRAACGAAPPSPPSPPAPAGSGCSAVSSVGLTARWPAVRGADLYDLEYTAAAAWGKPDLYTSQTSATASAAVVDLHPGVEYAFRVRSRKAGGSTWDWGEFNVASFSCTTGRSPEGEPRAVRRVGGLNGTTLDVAWDAAPGAPPGAAVRVTAHDGGEGHRGGWGSIPAADTAAAASLTTPHGAKSARLVGLAPGRVYWVRVGGSDPVPFRTARAGVMYVEMLRVSSHQNEIDLLTDKNTGDVAADAGYLTFASGSAVGSRWISQFKDIVMSQYCVEAVLGASGYAGYLSCDAGTKVPRKEPSCDCRAVCDANFAHETCALSPVNPNPKNGAQCLCKAADLAYSKKYLGRELIKLPFGSLSCDIPGSAPAKPTDTQLGYWYSTPSGGMCAEGAAVGTDGCTWSRNPVASVVRGSYLLSHGFTPGKTGVVTKAAADHNTAATSAVFTAHPTHRRCGA